MRQRICCPSLPWRAAHRTRPPVWWWSAHVRPSFIRRPHGGTSAASRWRRPRRRRRCRCTTGPDRSDFRIRLEPQPIRNPVRQAVPPPAAETFADRLPRAMALRQVPASGFDAGLHISPFTTCQWSRQRSPSTPATRGIRPAINSHSASLSSCRRIASLPLGDLHQEQPPPAAPRCSGRQSKPLPVAALIPCRDRGSFPPRPCRRSGRSC